MLVCNEKSKKKGGSLKQGTLSPTNKSNPVETQDEILRFKRMIPASAIQIKASTINGGCMPGLIYAGKGKRCLCYMQGKGKGKDRDVCTINGVWVCLTYYIQGN